MRLERICIILSIALTAGSAFAQEFDTNEKQLAEVYSGEYTGET